MTTRLHISTDLELPAEAITQTFAILAKRGVGKTYTASVMTEEMLKANLPVVVCDPIGVWWGLRASATGKSDGLPIIVLGGEHADAPLEDTAGELIADLVVDERVSLVLDLSLFRKAGQVRFMTDFAERLYHRNREPLHLMLDEADAFAPQRPMKGAERLLGAMEDLVRRGRARGLGMTLITQRPAVLNKNVLTQIEVLVAMRVVSPQDRAAIDEWVKVHGEPGQREELMESLPSLPIGTAWFWSPGWLDLFQRVAVRRRDTFDSSATPEVGGERVEPRKLAAVDLAALEERMAATIERAKAADPRELRRRIKELEAQVASPPERERVEVPVLTDEAREALTEAAGAIAEAQAQMVDAIADASRRLGEIVAQVGPRSAAPPPRASERRTLATPAPAPRRAAATPSTPPGAMQPAKQRILDALAALEQIGVPQADRTQLALFAQASPKSSGYANNLGALRSAGLIDYPAGARVQLTADGRSQADAGAAPSTVEEMHAYVAQLLSPAKWRLVAALIDSYPAALAKADLADAAGASPNSSGFANNLGSLRSLGLIDYPAPGTVAALPVLFLEGAPSG